MTEIKTEKQKPVWPWVLAVIVLGVIVYLAFFKGDGNMAMGTKADMEPGNEVSGYFQFIDNDPDTMGISHEFTNEAISRLTEAARAAAEQNNVDINEDLTSIQGYSTNFTEESFASSRADTIRVVTGDLATALVKIQEAKYPDLLKEANSLKAATVAIRADTLISEQEMEIKNFFRLAKDLLQKMYGQSS
jgi:hypothetical protein